MSFAGLLNQIVQIFTRASATRDIAMLMLRFLFSFRWSNLPVLRRRGAAGGPAA
jgi:hypothetical protein